MEKCAIRFAVVGDPVAAHRPRFARRGNYVTTYKDKADQEYQGLIAKNATRQILEYFGYGTPFPFYKEGEPCYVHIDVHRALPKSRKRSIEQEHDIYKPDVDNIAKNVLDGLTGIAYKDDAQVCALSVQKCPRKRGLKPYVTVLISPTPINYIF